MTDRKAPRPKSPAPGRPGRKSPDKPLRAGLGGDRSKRVEEQVFRLEPDLTDGKKPHRRVSYSDLVHDPKRRLQSHEESQEWGEPRRKGASTAWIVTSFVIVLLLIGLSLHYRNVIGEKDPEVNFIGMPPLSIEPREGNSREERIADLLGRQEEARELFDRFLKERHLGEVLKLVRIQPGVNYLAPRYHWHDPLPEDWRVPEDAKWDVYSNATPIYGLLSGYFPDDSPFHAFVTLEKGRLYLDWKATTGYGTATFAELHKGKGDGSEIRAWIEPAAYFSPAYPESDYHAFRVYSTLGDPPVWGYVEKTSDFAEKLKNQFRKSRILEDEKPGPKMYLLSMRKRNEGEADNQWLITGILHTEWIQP